MNEQLIKPILERHTTRHTEIKIPTIMGKDLAELVGIHFGDGGIHVRKRKTYTVTYSVGLKEIDLIEDIKMLFRKLFDIDLKRVNANNAVQFYCCSKMLAYFLNQNFGAPLGKKDNLKIPLIIKENNIYLSYFLKGLFRTDGCYFIKKFGKYEYPIVKITTKCKDFAEEIKDILIQLGFRAKINIKWGRWDFPRFLSEAYLNF